MGLNQLRGEERVNGNETGRGLTEEEMLSNS